MSHLCSAFLSLPFKIIYIPTKYVDMIITLKFSFVKRNLKNILIFLYKEKKATRFFAFVIVPFKQPPK